MLGCRPLEHNELEQCLTKLRTQRDIVLFLLMYKAGLRIKEALSFRIKDVYDGIRIFEHVKLERRNVKGKTFGREIIIDEQLSQEILKLVQNYSSLDAPLFASERKANFPITRRAALYIIREVFDELKLDNVGTHSFRKTFAEAVYEASEHDILIVRDALGHSSVTTTQRYLSTSRNKMKTTRTKMPKVNFSHCEKD